MNRTERIIAWFSRSTEALGLCLKRSFLRRSAAGRLLVDAVLLPSDLYKMMTTHRYHHGSLPNLVRPRTLNEKIQQTKLTYRAARYTQFADKVRVRDFVAGRVGAPYLTRMIWHGARLADFTGRDSLPNQFIIKTNQGSGTNIICRDRTTFDWDAAIRQTDHWLSYDHSVYYGEWCYRWIEPQVLIEELLVDENGHIPTDYKFYCFHGRAEILAVSYGRFHEQTWLMFDRNYSMIDVGTGYPRPATVPPRPPTLEAMTRIAEALSTGEELLRVDLYDVQGRIFFGEITLHPSAGTDEWQPASFDGVLFDMFSRGR